MKKILVGALANFIAMAAISQVNIFDAATLPASLRENAHSVKREEKITFEVKDIDEAKLSVHQVFTVLDASGDDVLFFNEYSSGFRKLVDAEIKVFDANGKFVNKYKLKEMHAQNTGEGLVDDGKVYYFRVTAPSYPVTVQYDSEVKYKGTLNYPTYYIQEPDQSVEHSTFTATVPLSIDLRFKNKHTDVASVTNTIGNNKFYNWEVKNLPPIIYEKGTSRYLANYPHVVIAPTKFSMDGKEGDLTSWKNFGIWCGSLYKDMVSLSDETKNYLRQMVAGATSDKEKAKIIYTYLQKNFRYVSIQLGIGGYKPFPASFVNDKKYGDCKALSNYTQACLTAIGITSYPALINAYYNGEPVDPAFPSNGFDHVILCIPGKPDTCWLECTSNSTDFGILGSFTENRYALLLTPDGGVLVPTPKSLPSENCFNASTKVILSEDASGESTSRIRTSGEYKQDIIHYVNEKKDDQKEYLVSTLGFIQPDIYELTSDKKKDSSEIDFNLVMDKVPDFTAGSKMFLHPRIYKMWHLKMPDDEKRTMPFYFECPFIKTDTTVYQLPENYTVENLPKARDNKFEYGS
ncbi:MAG: DUF3857 domain-containing protein, partial [Ginsengibacter sp.]